MAEPARSVIVLLPFWLLTSGNGNVGTEHEIFHPSRASRRLPLQGHRIPMDGTTKGVFQQPAKQCRRGRYFDKFEPVPNNTLQIRSQPLIKNKYALSFGGLGSR
jgi:hypothetical protein